MSKKRYKKIMGYYTNRYFLNEKCSKMLYFAFIHSSSMKVGFLAQAEGE